MKRNRTYEEKMVVIVQIRRCPFSVPSLLTVMMTTIITTIQSIRSFLLSLSFSIISFAPAPSPSSSSSFLLRRRRCLQASSEKKLTAMVDASHLIIAVVLNR